MSVFATKDTTKSFVFVRTLACHVPEFFAISALDRRIWVYVVPRLLVFELAEHVIVQFIFFFLTSFWCDRHPRLRLLQLSFLILLPNGPSEIHVPLQSTTRYKKVWVSFCIQSCDVVITFSLLLRSLLIAWFLNLLNFCLLFVFYKQLWTFVEKISVWRTSYIEWCITWQTGIGQGVFLNDFV